MQLEEHLQEHLQEKLNLSKDFSTLNRLVYFNEFREQCGQFASWRIVVNKLGGSKKVNTAVPRPFI